MLLPQAELMQQQQKFFARMEAHFQFADSNQQPFVAAGSGVLHEVGSSVLTAGAPSACANTPQECSDAASGPVSSSSQSPAPSTAGLVLHRELTDDDAATVTRTNSEVQGSGNGGGSSGSSSISRNVASSVASALGIQNSITPLIVHFSAVAATAGAVVEAGSGAAGSSSTGESADLESISKMLVAMPDDRDNAERVRTDSLQHFGNA
jgi:hypothetical protein